MHCLEIPLSCRMGELRVEFNALVLSSIAFQVETLGTPPRDGLPLE
jgi:hypothetical protein